MLDMDLIQGKPALKVEFQISLAADLINIVPMVINAPWLEGLDQWVYATHAALPPTLKSDLEVVLTLTHKSYLVLLRVARLPLYDPAHRDFAAFAAWLNTFSEDDFGDLVQSTLEKLSTHHEDKGISSPSLDDAGALLRAVLHEKFSKEQIERVVHLAHNPAELKSQFISVHTRFWEQFYHQEYQRSLSLMEHSVEHHRLQNYSADLFTVFTAVAGRRFPKDRDDYEDVERVIFFPTCYIGPYVLFHDFKELRPTLILHYNCRPTGVPEREQSPTVQELFPPIKALSDETRLQILSLLNGRELYAQEIVKHLDISQSAVSRHLKLMLAGGLLTMRKQDSMKYFSINEETLAVLADKLESFRAKM